jgi:hypothetical protein
MVAGSSPAAPAIFQKGQLIELAFRISVIRVFPPCLFRSSPLASLADLPFDLIP